MSSGTQRYLAPCIYRLGNTSRQRISRAVVLASFTYFGKGSFCSHAWPRVKGNPRSSLAPRVFLASVLQDGLVNFDFTALVFSTVFLWWGFKWPAEYSSGILRAWHTTRRCVFVVFQHFLVGGHVHQVALGLHKDTGASYYRLYFWGSSNSWQTSSKVFLSYIPSAKH